MTRHKEGWGHWSRCVSSCDTSQKGLTSLVTLCFTQDLFNYVSTKLVAKMDILECMYIRQAIDLLQGKLQFIATYFLPNAAATKLISQKLVEDKT